LRPLEHHWPAEAVDRLSPPASGGWAWVTIVARYQGANLYEAFDAIDGDHETVAAALVDPRGGDLPVASP
jgi:hypothetical protein